MSKSKSPKNLASLVRRAVERTPIIDIHTHIYPPAFGELLLWGIDELITYHYLIAEVFRHHPMPYADFWAMTKQQQAELIWDELFLRHSPISESCRGVLTALDRLGIGVKGRSLDKIRNAFAKRPVEEQIDLVFEAANLRYVVMTNNPFDPLERPVWLKKNLAIDSRFKAALRLDDILNGWPAPVAQLKDWGYKVTSQLTAGTVREVRRFLGEWIDRMGALYMAVSLPPDFAFPDGSPRSALIEKCVLPVAHEKGVPFAMMIGVKKLANPALQLAGDSVGPADVDAVEALCRDFPDNRFMVTFLARENQHGACIAARKFHNLMLFGCWWFMNNPSIIDEITRERIELLGTSFIPQHSDARVLDQLVYKWAHSRALIADALTDKYADLAATGWKIDPSEIKRDVLDLFGDNFERFLKQTPRLV